MGIEDGKAEPPPEKRGSIARIYFYMDWAYPGHGVISKKIENCLRRGTRKIRLMHGNVRGAKGFKGMKTAL